MSDESSAKASHPWKDEELRLLGLYVARFSQLVEAMRSSLIGRLQTAPNPAMLAHIVLAGAGPREMKNAFFDAARLITDHGPAETEISEKLEKAVDREITHRNLIAHGEILIGGMQMSIENPEPEPLPARIDRFNRGKRSSSQPDLEGRSQAIARLTYLVSLYGVAAISEQTTISYELEMKDGKVVPAR